MKFLKQVVERASRSARRRRGRVFTAQFELDANTRILDLGGGNGAHLNSILRGTKVRRCNVFIADIDPGAIAEAHRRFGFTPVRIDESGCLPFPVGYFDIVYCSSVIEHVTVPKDCVWQVRCGREFRMSARERQKRFAGEITRLGRQYFVQTPNRGFPLESHSWLPFVGFLPRPALLRVLRFTNRFWIKRTAPDWNLLDRNELSALFPGAAIMEERAFGMTKSLMAIKSLGGATTATADIGYPSAAAGTGGTGQSA